MPPQNLPRWRRYLTVEPVVLFYTFGIFMSLPVLTQYVYFRVSKFKGFPYNVSETSEKGCNDDAGANSSLKELEKEVQFKQTRGTQRRFPPKCIENTFSLIQSTFRSLEMYSKRRYKSCICSVVLGQLESFRNHLGPQYYFPENFRCNFRFYESENFSDSSLHRIFESENFRFPFSTKNRLTWGLKCEKLNFRKS